MLPARAEIASCREVYPTSKHDKIRHAAAWLSFGDFLFQAEGESDDFAALGLGQLELIESERQTPHERRIVGLADAHPLVRQLHVASQIDRRSASRCGDKINRQLAFAVVRVDAAGTGPEPPEQRILMQPRQEIIDDGGDRVVPASRW